MELDRRNYNQDFLDLKQKKYDIFNNGMSELVDISTEQKNKAMRTEAAILELYVLVQRAKAANWAFSSYKALLDSDARDFLMENSDNHICGSETCHLLNPAKGELMRYEVTGEVVRASGDLWICSRTGMIHVCSGKQHCSKTTIDPNNHEEGYYCIVTKLWKGSFATEIPACDPKRPVGETQRTRWKRGESHKMGNYQHTDEGYDMEDMRQFESGQSFRNKDLIYDGSAPLKQLKHIQRAVRQAKRQKAKTPQEKTRMHMRGLEDKFLLAQSIAKLMMYSGNQVEMYNSRVHKLAQKATKKLESERGKAKREMSLIECKESWMRYMVANMPKRPNLVPNVKYKVYADAMLQMWQLVAYSPHAQQDNGPRQRPIHFEELCFSLLYQMRAGGFVVPAMLPKEKLVGLEHLKEYSIVTSFGIQVIPYDETVALTLPAQEDIVELRRHSQTNANPGAKIVFQGEQQLRACLTSIFYALKQDCIESLAKTDNKQAVLRKYIEDCKSQKIVLNG